MRSFFFVIMVIGLSLLLITPAFAQTEDELVAKFLKKTERKQSKKVGFLVVNGSFGRLFQDNDYNKFTTRVNPLLASVGSTTPTVEKINNSYELFGGFGMISSRKTAAQFGFTYWLKQGSAQTGDFNLSLVNMNDPGDLYGFNLKSEIQVYGLTGEVHYYLSEPPDKYGKLHNIAFKLGAGFGFYFANWELWDGFTGYNLSAGTSEVIEGKLKGSAPGFKALAGAELPIGLAGLVVEGAAQFLYLNFTGMKWYNSNNEETVATVNNSGKKVELNMSGPRVQLGLKRYFSW
jgi:hypothetical protein